MASILGVNFVWGRHDVGYCYGIATLDCSKPAIHRNQMRFHFKLGSFHNSITHVKNMPASSTLQNQGTIILGYFKLSHSKAAKESFKRCHSCILHLEAVWSKGMNGVELFCKSSFSRFHTFVVLWFFFLKFLRSNCKIPRREFRVYNLFLPPIHLLATVYTHQLSWNILTFLWKLPVALFQKKPYVVFALKIILLFLL